MNVKSPLFEVQADFNHQMLVGLCVVFFFPLSGQYIKDEVRCFSYYLQVNNLFAVMVYGMTFIFNLSFFIPGRD